MLNDVKLQHASPSRHGRWNQVEILVSDGDIPARCQATGQRRMAASGGQRHRARGLSRAASRHEQPARQRCQRRIRRTGGSPWRGAYMNAPIDPDPWGNRYAVNVEFLTGGTEDVVVFSAGPDEQVDSASTPPTGSTAGDDDLMRWWSHERPVAAVGWSQDPPLRTARRHAGRGDDRADRRRHSCRGGRAGGVAHARPGQAGARR